MKHKFTMKEMTNLDHSIDDGLEDDLKAGLFGTHSACNFNGVLSYNNGEFIEEVYVYHEPVDLIRANSLKELMNKVNEKYGDE